MISMAFGGTSIGVLYAVVNLLLIPFLSKKFGDPQLPGQLVSIGMLSTVFVGPLIGVLSDRMKKRTPFVLLISIAGSVSILGLIFPSKIVAAAAGVLVVASAFCFLTPYSALISDYSPQNKKDRNFGIVTGVVNITTFLASIFINVTYESNSQLTFFVLSMVVLLSVIPLLLYVRKEPPASANIAEKERQKEKSILLFLKKHPLFLICLFIQFGFWFSFGGLIPYLTSFLNAELSMGLGSAAMWVGALTLISGGSAFLTGRMSNLLGQKRLFMISISTMLLLTTMISCLYNSMMSDSFFAVFWMISFFGFGIASGFLQSLSVSILSSTVSPQEQGKVFGINNVVIIVAESTSVSLIGYLISARGYRWMFVTVMGGFLFALFASLVLFSKSARMRDIVSEG